MSLLSSEDWLQLIEIARQSITIALLEGRAPDLPQLRPALAEQRGVFVTLYSGGKLRGCVGRVDDPGPLADAVAAAAISAALYDPRFRPVRADELAALQIEISLLSPFEPIAPEAIMPGVHGLMVVRHDARGLLLPQVAQERVWSGIRFLEETCVKAGLAPNAWRDPQTSILGFTAEIFSEANVATSSNR